MKLRAAWDKNVAGVERLAVKVAVLNQGLTTRPEDDWDFGVNHPARAGALGGGKLLTSVIDAAYENPTANTRRAVLNDPQVRKFLEVNDDATTRRQLNAYVQQWENLLKTTKRLNAALEASGLSKTRAAEVSSGIITDVDNSPRGNVREMATTAIQGLSLKKPLIRLRHRHSGVSPR